MSRNYRALARFPDFSMVAERTSGLPVTPEQAEAIRRDFYAQWPDLAAFMDVDAALCRDPEMFPLDIGGEG